METIHPVVVPFKPSQKLRLNQKKTGNNRCLYLYIPPVLIMDSTKGCYINFKTNYGVSFQFRNFVVQKLRATVSKWNTFHAVQQWLQQCQKWKEQVETSWDNLLRKCPVKRKQPQESTVNNKVARVGRKTTTLSVPIKGFLLAGEVPVIRIRPETNSKGSKFLRMYLPRKVFGGKAKVKKKSLQTRFGHDKRWSKFVVEHLASVVENWSSVSDAQAWFNEGGADLFVKHINLVWLKYQGKKRVWELRKSGLPVNKKWWPNATGPGSGLFCTVKGSHQIVFPQGPLSIWTTQTPAAGSIEENYAFGPKKGPWFLPSAESFKSGVIFHGFKVQHSGDKKKITHKCKLVSDQYVFEPRKETQIGDEFAFDYGYDRIVDRM